jgi:hypothetical protein
MKKYIPILLLIGISILFFYKTILLGKVPFPGDLLLTQYAPWRHESYGGYVAGAIPSKDQYFDVIRELYPWKTQVISSLKQGAFPLWNPYNFSGAPLLANYQSQVFYPLTFLYFLMPQMTAWTIMVMLQPILGSIFLYLFATEIGLTSAAALLTALLFNFSSFANVWIEFTTIWHTILWLPLLLYFVERGIKQQKLYLYQQILFIFALFCAITAGHPQDFINLFIFLLIYIILRRSWSLLLLSIIPFLLAAPQIFPTIELFRNSARVAHDYRGIINNMLIQWWQMPLLVVQDLFGNPATKSNFTGDYVGKTLSVGVAGFFFVLAALCHKAGSWHKKFFACTALGILLITVRTPLTQLLYRYPWPILSTGTPTRILFILSFALAVLAGFGYDAIRLNKKLPFKPLITGWIVFLFLWIFLFAQPAIAGLNYTVGAVSTMKRSMIVATGILGCLTLILLASRYKKYILWLTLPLTIAELLYGFLKFNPFVPALFVYPQNKLITYLQKTTGINRFWGYGTAGIEANFATQEYIYSPDGTDPLNLRWYNQFIQASREGNIAVTFNRTTRSDAQVQPGYGQKDLPSNEFRLRIMDTLGVKYVIDRSENPKDDNTFPTDRFKIVRHEDDWTVYENLKAAPRYFLTSDVRPYESTVKFKHQFFAPDFQPEKTVLLDAQDYQSLPLLVPSQQSTHLISYSPNSVKISVNTETPKLLFLSDTYDTGWTVTINGKRTNVYRADYALRGVLVPAGESTVTFIYQPQSFRVGVAISIITLIFLVTGISVHIYNRHNTKK